MKCDEKGLLQKRVGTMLLGLDMNKDFFSYFLLKKKNKVQCVRSEESCNMCLYKQNLQQLPLQCNDTQVFIYICRMPGTILLTSITPVFRKKRLKFLAQ
jgi:hypothetical protein